MVEDLVFQTRSSSHQRTSSARTANYNLDIRPILYVNFNPSAWYERQKFFKHFLKGLGPWLTSSQAAIGQGQQTLTYALQTIDPSLQFLFLSNTQHDCLRGSAEIQR